MYNEFEINRESFNALLRDRNEVRPVKKHYRLIIKYPASMLTLKPARFENVVSDLSADPVEKALLVRVADRQPDWDGRPRRII